MSSPKKCPNCGLINPDIAQRCDCGYDFECGEIKSPYVKPSRKKHLLKPEGTPTGIKDLGRFYLMFASVSGIVFPLVILRRVFRSAWLWHTHPADIIPVVIPILAVIIGICILVIIASIHLMELKKWAWSFFIICHGLFGTLCVIIAFSGFDIATSLVALLLNVLILWYLYSAKEHYFKPALSQVSLEEKMKEEHNQKSLSPISLEEKMKVDLNQHLKDIGQDLPSLGELKETLNDEDVTTRLWAIQELKRTGSKDALQLLETLLDDKDEDVRAAAKEAIRDIQGGV